MHWYNLTDLLPPVFSSIKSMFAAADTENTELLKINISAGKLRDNFYIQTCDVETIKYWESLLDITPSPSETLDQRRNDVLTHIVNNQPITEPYVKKVLLDTFGEGNYSFEYDVNNNLIVYVSVYNKPIEDVERFFRWFSLVCPAHIDWFFEHVDTSDTHFAIYGHAESDYGATATMTMSTGTATLYYGETAVTVDTLEL